MADIYQIIQACKNGERRAQKALYLLTSTEVMNVCRRYVVDHDAARDIFQDTYLKAFQKIHQYNSAKGSIGAWLARIAVNTALVYFRTQKRIELVDEFISVLEPVSKEDIMADFAAEEIYKQVMALPDGYRIVFNLYVVEGYSHEEIGDLLNIATASSRSQLARARAILKKQIKHNLNHTIHEKA